MIFTNPKFDASKVKTVDKNSGKRKWTVDLYQKINNASPIPSPPGFDTLVDYENSEETRDAVPRLVIKKSLDIALSPLKSAPMNLIIMYMSGNSISIFPIMMIGMMLIKQFQALWAINTTFKSIEGNKYAVLQKLLYLFGTLVNFGLALYKCQSMGLLPTHASDWLAFQEPAIQMEFTHGGLSLT